MRELEGLGVMNYNAPRVASNAFSDEAPDRQAIFIDKSGGGEAARRYAAQPAVTVERTALPGNGRRNYTVDIRRLTDDIGNVVVAEREAIRIAKAFRLRPHDTVKELNPQWRSLASQLPRSTIEQLGMQLHLAEGANPKQRDAVYRELKRLVLDLRRRRLIYRSELSRARTAVLPFRDVHEKSREFTADDLLASLGLAEPPVAGFAHGSGDSILAFRLLRGEQ